MYARGAIILTRITLGVPALKVPHLYHQKRSARRHGTQHGTPQNAANCVSAPTRDDLSAMARRVIMRCAALLLIATCASASIVMHETFDSPSGFTQRNLLGPVAFFVDGTNEYFGINKGNGASYFSCPVPMTFPTYGTASCPTDRTTWVGTDNVPASARAYTGFTGAYIEATKVHGAGTTWFSASPFILTWSASGSCSGTLVFSGKFASASTGLETDDYVRVQASVDGAANVTVLEFRGNPNDRFAVDTDMDGIGDGTLLGLSAGTFTATIPGMMTSSVVLSVALRTSSTSEDIAADDIMLTCGPTVVSPPPPPSHPTIGRHARCARTTPARTPRTHTAHAHG